MVVAHKGSTQATHLKHYLRHIQISASMPDIYSQYTVLAIV